MGNQRDLFPEPPQAARSFPVAKREPYKPLECCPRCGIAPYPHRYWWSVKEGSRCDDCFWIEVEAEEKGLRK